MPMRLGATNPRSTPIYRRELHRLPLCELPSRDTEQQTLAKFLSKQKSTDNIIRFAHDFCSARHSSSKLDSALAYRKNSTVAMRH